MTDGILLVNKPVGMTSFGVVARVRRVLSAEQKKKVKVGHTGTLDPFATGLMILVIGKECKNASRYSKLDKVYEATICLGKTSTTGDPEGEVMEVSSEVPVLNDVVSALDKFVGQIKQRPPIYSAIKINGQRAYDLARAGKDIDMPERLIFVHSIELINYSYPNVIIKAHVSSGTYIRSLARDIGDYLGVGAYCTSLKRVSVDNWTIEQAISLSDMGVLD